MKVAKPLPPTARLWEMFELNPLTGILYRLATASNFVRGSQIGSPSRGHLTVSVDNERYQVHRLIYKWVTGLEPAGIIEHLDDVGTNNVPWNLIDSTDRNNSITYALLSGKSLPVGVEQGSKNNYYSRITIDGNRYYLGSYQTPQEASDAYQSAVTAVNENPDWRPKSQVKTKSSSTPGVSYFSKDDRWIAMFHKNKVRHYVGSFETEEEAIQALAEGKLQAALSQMLEVELPDDFTVK